MIRLQTPALRQRTNRLCKWCRHRSCSVGRATARRTAAPQRCHSRHADHLHAARRGPCSAWSDGAPLIVRKFAAHDPSLQIEGLNHDPPSTCNEATAAIGISAFEAEPEIFCSIRALTVVTQLEPLQGRGTSFHKKVVKRSIKRV